MCANAAAALMGLILCSPGAQGAVTVRAEERLPAKITGHLEGPADNPMQMPTDVAVDAPGQVFVADGARDRIVRFTPQGKMDLAITEPGGRKLNSPLGLTIDNAARLWIADSGNRRLVLTTLDGQYIDTLGLPTPEGGQPCHPTDVALVPGGERLYVVDNANHQVLVHRQPSGPWTVLGRRGRGLGEFEYPFTICIEPQGYAYVCEALGARVQRISPANLWAGQVGRWGVEVGRLYRPKGVAADARGRLFVSDSTLEVVQVYGPEGAVQGVLTDEEGRPLRFSHPMGMCLDSAGRLYVVELGAGRVAIVSFHPSPPPSPVAPAEPKGKEDAR
jgi:sugar lactone lactonase YvrE